MPRKFTVNCAKLRCAHGIKPGRKTVQPFAQLSLALGGITCGASARSLKSAPTAACRSARNASALKNLRPASSCFASTQATTTPYWPHHHTKNTNQCFFSPIAPPENCPALLTTKKSCFENYATATDIDFDFCVGALTLHTTPWESEGMHLSTGSLFASNVK